MDGCMSVLKMLSALKVMGVICMKSCSENVCTDAMENAGAVVQERKQPD